MWRPLLLATALLQLAVLSLAYTELKNIVREENLLSKEYDVVVFICDELTNNAGEYQDIQKAIDDYQKVDPATTKGSAKLIPFLAHPSKHLIIASTGSLKTDTSDSRLIYNAASKAFSLVYKGKFRKPLFVIGKLHGAAADLPWTQGIYPQVTAMLGALHEMYTPLQVREMRPEVFPKYDKIGVFKPEAKVIDIVKAIEEGRYIHRDLCATDEERMAAPAVERYIKENIPLNGNLKITYEFINKTKYPMIAAVDRLYENSPKYKGRIIEITYTPPTDTEVNETLFFIGKGITFDTGGYSLKTKGSMQFMRKDKCGATSIVGFMRALDILKPKGLKVNAKLAFVRNGIGDDAYLVDEIIPSAAGVRSRIGSTDAEGRNVMVDLLVYSKEEALKAKNPHLFTIATLTGAVHTSYGLVPAAVDNGPARLKGYAKALSQGGALVGDPIEVATLRREDYEVCFPVSEYEDLQQRNTHAETVKYRGNQYPAAWMLLASKMVDHGLQAPEGQQLPYTHMDISNAVGVKNSPATGTPVPMLISTYVLPRLM